MFSLKLSVVTVTGIAAKAWVNSTPVLLANPLPLKSSVVTVAGIAAKGWVNSAPFFLPTEDWPNFYRRYALAKRLRPPLRLHDHYLH